MAMIYQASAGAANANKITISMWCRAHNAPSDTGYLFSLLEFGDPEGNAGGIANYLEFRAGATSESFGSYIAAQFCGVKDSVSISSVFTGSSSSVGEGTLKRPVVDDWIGIGNPYNAFTDPTTYLTPFARGTTVDLGSDVDPGKWFHLMVAADYSHDVDYDGALTSSNRLYIVVNGVARSVYGLAGEGHAAVTGGKTYQGARCEQDTPTASTINNYIGLGPFEWSNPSDSGSAIVPAFDFDLNGTEIGIPSQTESSNKNSELLDMADVQIWVGTFIDPTNSTNFSKFVDVNELGGGTPVNPDIAADYFGQQTYLFKGTRDDFLINQGTGGAFSYSGTITDSSGVAY